MPRTGSLEPLSAVGLVATLDDVDVVGHQHHVAMLVDHLAALDDAT